MIKHMKKRARNLFFIFLLTTSLAACGANSRSDVSPGYDNLSGNYTFVGLGDFTADQFPNPLVDFTDIQTPTDISIVHSGDVFQIEYLSSAGVLFMKSIDLNNDDIGDVEWRNSMLTTTERVSDIGAPILPLPAKHYRGTRILRGEDGSLYVIGFYEEDGFLFTDYFEHELMLEQSQ